MTLFSGMRIGYLERRHSMTHQGSVTEQLLPLLRQRGARVEVVHAEEAAHRVDVAPPWDLVVLKSGSAAALHLAAVAEAYGIASVNTSDATRTTRDKLSSSAILRRAGLPLPSSYLAWLGTTSTESASGRLEELSGGSWVVKSARGWHGKGVWFEQGVRLPALAESLPDGPYLVMEQVEHAGDDLKVFVAGQWMDAIQRPFPATTLSDKQGCRAALPADVAVASRRVGQLLGLRCYGCDFVSGAAGWTLVDVNAFPGYKGAPGAPEALVDEIESAAKGAS